MGVVLAMMIAVMIVCVVPMTFAMIVPARVIVVSVMVVVLRRL